MNKEKNINNDKRNKSIDEYINSEILKDVNEDKTPKQIKKDIRNELLDIVTGK